MRTRIGVLAILGVAAVSALTIGVMAALVVRTHRDALTRQIEHSADQLCETISSSTYYDMLENRRDDLHQQIERIGRQQGIERVRLFNQVGTIMFSSDAAEIGRSVDKRAEACFACHAADQPLTKLPTRARSRIFRANGHRVLGMIRPIPNQPGCWTPACHAHRADQAVLGVLDVNLSLAGVDAQIADDQRRMLLLAILAIGASSLLLWWLNGRLVVRPVAALIAGTRKVAEGDLGTVLPANARHELGDLARAFNEMTQRLGQAQRELTQADKLASVGRLAAGVAHEINNPLTGVLTYASFLQKRASNDPDLQRDLEVIVRETRRCREIIKNLLDFSRRSEPVRQPSDLNEVARRAVVIVMNQLALDRVQLALDLAADVPPVPVDPNQIQQVVVNLLLNAADSLGGRGGNIRIATSRTEDDRGRRFAELTVEDTGRGITEEEKRHLFEPFFTTKGNRGVGLGLAVSWGIVERHGGSIDVASEAGKGARFTVRLPYQTASQPEAVPAREAELPAADAFRSPARITGPAPAGGGR